jgi:hypothetical protein
MRSLLLVESLDLRPINQYFFVKVIPSCFRFAKMCLCQVSPQSRCSPRYLTLHIVYVVRGARFFLCSECYVDRLGFVSFDSLFLKPVLDCK